MRLPASNHLESLLGFRPSLVARPSTHDMDRVYVKRYHDLVIIYFLVTDG